VEALIFYLIALGVIIFVAPSVRQLWARRSAVEPKILVERNRDVIVSYNGRVTGDTGRDYIDNLTRDCLSEIARQEQRPGLRPHRESLSNWERRSDIPSEWLYLKDRIRAALSAKHDAVLKKLAKSEEERRAKEEDERVRRAREQEERVRRATERIEEKRRQLYVANRDLIEKFFKIAERKVSLIDEYGEENWDALQQEVETCFTKIAKRNGYSDKTIKDVFKKGTLLKFPEEYWWLKQKLEEDFRTYHQIEKARPASSFNVNGLTGVEFETWIGKRLRERGFEVSGTPNTGDQGADLIAKKNDRTIVIQAKRHQGAVGNKAVQEVIGAIAYYGGDEGWVVTNSSFTRAAKALAQKNNVRLVDGKNLEQEWIASDA
jgi:hypothetical protein